MHIFNFQIPRWGEGWAKNYMIESYVAEKGYTHSTPSLIPPPIKKPQNKQSIKQTIKEKKEFNVDQFCFIHAYKTCVSTPLPRLPFKNYPAPCLV